MYLNLNGMAWHGCWHSWKGDGFACRERKCCVLLRAGTYAYEWLWGVVCLLYDMNEVGIGVGMFQVMPFFSTRVSYVRTT